MRSAGCATWLRSASPASSPTGRNFFFGYDGKVFFELEQSSTFRRQRRGNTRPEREPEGRLRRYVRDHVDPVSDDLEAGDRSEERLRDDVADEGVHAARAVRPRNLDRLRPNEDEHALAGSATVRRLDLKLRPAVVDPAFDDGAREAVHRADELRDERRGRRAVHLGGRTHLLDPTAPHDRNMIGDR